MALFENVFKRRSLGKLFGQEREPIIPYGPVRSWLAEYEPFLIKDRPKAFGQQYIADTITREEAIKATAASKWALEYAEGMLRFTGVSPAEPSYEEKKKELARRVAERMWA